MEDKYFDRINQYLRGELGEEDIAALDRELETDAKLREQFVLHKAMVEGIQQQRHDELKKYLTEQTKIKFMGNIWGTRWALASAAIIALFAVLYVVIQYFDIGESAQPIVKSEETELNQDSLDQVQSEDLKLSQKDNGLNDNGSTEKEFQADQSIQEQLADQRIEGTETDKEKIPLPATEKPEMAASKRITSEDSKDYKTKSEIKIGEETLIVSVISINGTLKESDSDSEQSFSITGTEELNVEYWISPVGFKGYKLEGSNLILYSLNQNSGIRLYKIKAQIYLKEGFNIYHLNSDGRYREYEKAVNPEILQSIPE